MKMHKITVLVLTLASMMGALGCQSKKDEQSKPGIQITESSLVSTAIPTDESVGSVTESASCPSGFNSTFTVIANGFDWGPAVTRIIIELKNEITENDLCDFAVTETHGDKRTFNRKVTDVFLSDANGLQSNTASKYITLEMSVAPTGEGLIFYYDLSVYQNTWDKNYRLSILAVNPKNDTLKQMRVDPVYVKAITPEADVFDQAEFTSGAVTMKYAFFTPANSGEKKPLIIWLHGQGEGGNDASVVLLGNKVTALAKDKIQSYFGGAYVLSPQCPTYWPESKPAEGYFGTRATVNSIYQEALMQLIEEFVAAHGSIDTDRIYIGGCSMGGYMTMNMLNHYPGYFAAAFPVSEYYPDELITPKMTENLLTVPLWFLYSTIDNVVNPAECAAATIARLKKAGASNLHSSVFPDVHDTSGKYSDQNGSPYKYDPHWSWIYLFNDESSENGISTWEWLSKQKRSN